MVLICSEEPRVGAAQREMLSAAVTSGPDQIRCTTLVESPAARSATPAPTWPGPLEESDIQGNPAQTALRPAD